MQPPPKDKPAPLESPQDGSWEQDQQQNGYYYDDAFGYEEFKGEDDEGPLTIWTIGHSTRSLREFIGLLQANDIEIVADVRSLPGSRKFPYFNAELLGPELGAAGIEYVQIKKLGGRRSVRKDSPNTVWRNKAFRGYADHMETREFEEGIDSLLEFAAKGRTAIMCAEAVWWRCHRSMIADYLKANGVVVEHIISSGKNEVHPYTSAAKIINGKLAYGPAEE